MSGFFDKKPYRRYPIEKHEDRVKMAVNYTIMHPGEKIGIVCDAHNNELYRSEIMKSEHIEITADLAGPAQGMWTFTITRKM